jgi:hypothetical protein
MPYDLRILSGRSSRLPPQEIAHWAQMPCLWSSCFDSIIGGAPSGVGRSIEYQNLAAARMRAG